MKKPVHAVTSALLDSGLAFSHDPFHKDLPYSTAWFLEFEDDQEQVLWLAEPPFDPRRGSDDPGLVLVFAMKVPLRLPGDAEEPQELSSGIWIMRTTDGASATTTLQFDELQHIRTTAYELLSAIERNGADPEQPQEVLAGPDGA